MHEGRNNEKTKRAKTRLTSRTKKEIKRKIKSPQTKNTMKVRGIKERDYIRIFNIEITIG